MLKIFLLCFTLLTLLFAEDVKVNPQHEYDVAMQYLSAQKYKKAFSHLKIAAENNISNAQYNLALMYYQGDGVKQDIKKSAHWLEKAAKNGHEKAIQNVGRIYMQLMNFKKARYWLHKNVEQGDKEAQLLLDEIKGLKE